MRKEQSWWAVRDGDGHWISRTAPDVRQATRDDPRPLLQIIGRNGGMPLKGVWLAEIEGEGGERPTDSSRGVATRRLPDEDVGAQADRPAYETM
jgi:hypothetical protein